MAIYENLKIEKGTRIHAVLLRAVEAEYDRLRAESTSADALGDLDAAHRLLYRLDSPHVVAEPEVAPEPAPWSEVMRDMRGWCEDCFSDMPEDATDAEVLACVKRQYEGGIAGFLQDGAAVYGQVQIPA